MLLLPWHLDEHSPEGLNVTPPPGFTEVEGRPGSTGHAWNDLVGVYAGLADAVAAGDDDGDDDVTVLTGDCMSAVAVLAGLQRRGLDPGVVWFDGHGDFHTETTTMSGYLGGMPLAKLVGRGDLTLPRALGLSPVAEERVVLIDARDLDPPEVEALADSAVRHAALADLAPSDLPEGPVYLHVDLDVVDPAELRGLRFPAPGGPSVEAVAAAVATVSSARPVVGLSLAATWYPDSNDRGEADRVVAAVLAAAGRSPATGR